MLLLLVELVELVLLGSLSSDVFERRTSTGSEVFSLLTCLDDIKFVFLSFFTVIEAIWLKICAKPPSKNEKRPLPVDVRRSKTLLLKLPISTTSLQLKVTCCVFMFSIIVSIWRCRFAMNGRKIYKTLKTHVKTHPVALLLYFFFFFIVSKPPSLTLPSWVLKVPSRFMLPAKKANVIFCLRKT